MKPNDANDDSIFLTKTTISDAPSWFSSLVHQVRELQEERRNPPKRAQITAEQDPSALERLVETSSPLTSLISDVRGLIQDTLHPRKIETSVAPVEVEELWSRPARTSKWVLSAAVHAGILGLALFPWATSLPKLQATETAVMLYTPTPPLILPVNPDKPGGGGGGGGMRTPTPPSLGKLPRAADMQLVPPTPEIKNLNPELIAEPTIVAPQLKNLPQLSLLDRLGDPEGIPGPPSAGPGSGGGIGTGTGRGVGAGNGPGVGDGSGGGVGGGVFRPGGGVTAPEVVYKIDPQYSEDARRAKVTGTVILEAIVHKDGTVEIIRTVRTIGFGLEENARKALQQWRFSPGKRNGVPVDVSLNIEVNFNLR